MAAFDPNNAETCLGKSCDEFGAGETWSEAHAAIVTRWSPTNSNFCSGASSTSRHKAMASRLRSVTSSSERTCVWQPGICGTEST